MTAWHLKRAGVACLLLFGLTGAPAGAEPPSTTRLYPHKVAGKWGYIDAAGKTVIQAEYDHALPFSEGLALVLKGGRWVCLDPAGAVRFEAPRQNDLSGFDGGFARGSVGLGYHFFDRRGRMLPGRYAGTQPYAEGLAAVRIDPARFEPKNDRAERPLVKGAWGYIDAAGALVIPARFGYAGRFSGGLAPVYVGGEDRECAGLAGGAWGFIDRTGKVVVAPAFALARPYSGGLAAVVVTREGKRLCGYIDPAGQYAIAPRPYLVADDFNEGLAAVRVDGPDGRWWGAIDRRGDMVVPARFGSVEGYSEGVAAAAEQPTWDGRRWVPGGWGHIDQAGNWVVPPRYTRAGPFTGGLAAVEEAGDGFGYIDRQGRRVAWTPTGAVPQ